MIEITDFSGRRGAVVPILPKIHELLKTNATQDKLTSVEAPEHIVIWQQKMRRFILDINRRLFIAQDGNDVVGIFFYRHDGANIMIEEVQIAWKSRHNQLIMDGFLKKLEQDPKTRDATFFADVRIKKNSDKEMLAAKGLKDAADNEPEQLGTFGQAAAAMKIRYARS